MPRHLHESEHQKRPEHSFPISRRRRNGCSALRGLRRAYLTDTSYRCPCCRLTGRGGALSGRRRWWLRWLHALAIAWVTLVWLGALLRAAGLEPPAWIGWVSLAAATLVMHRILPNGASSNAD